MISTKKALLKKRLIQLIIIHRNYASGWRQDVRGALENGLPSDPIYPRLINEASGRVQGFLYALRELCDDRAKFLCLVETIGFEGGDDDVTILDEFDTDIENLGQDAGTVAAVHVKHREKHR